MTENDGWRSKTRNPPVGFLTGRPGPSRGFRLFAAGLIIAGAALPAAAQKTVILVRHAEKADSSKDAVLSEAGHARARNLAAWLARAGVAAIYASEYRRTIQTAEPLAAALNIPVESFPAADPAGLAEQLRTRHPDDVVLVVGHSNTLPDLLRCLGHPAAETIADDDFGSLFVLVPRPGLPPAVVRIRY
jgi:broad specificity phosphatase PhoE